VPNDEIRIRMNGKKDSKNNDYYLAITDMPMLVDLNNAVIVLFPDEGEDGKFGGDLVIRRYRGSKPSTPPPRKRQPVRREVPPSDEDSDG